MSYFMVEASVDGWGISNPMTKAAVLKSLRNMETSEDWERIEIVYCKSMEELDPEYVKDGVHKVMIIKGEVVMPEAKETVTEYDID